MKNMFSCQGEKPFFTYPRYFDQYIYRFHLLHIFYLSRIMVLYINVLCFYFLIFILTQCLRFIYLPYRSYQHEKLFSLFKEGGVVAWRNTCVQDYSFFGSSIKFWKEERKYIF